MVVMRLKADNLFAFNNFCVDFSYPKKIVSNPLEKEWLKNYPNFRYRRFNVIIGANSSGKTTFGKLLNGIFILLVKKETNSLVEAINDKEKESSFEIDFVNDDVLYRVKCIIPSCAEGESKIYIKLSIRQTDLIKEDSYETASHRIENIEEEYSYYVDALEKQMTIGWSFCYPENSHVSYNYQKEDEEMYRGVLETILKILDPSIEKVVKNKLMDRCFYIYYKDSKDPLVVENGRPLSSINYMSSGTKYAFNIAKVIYGLKRDIFGFYYLDEQFSFVNSEVEAALIAYLSGFSDNDDQIFITTHNRTVLEMDFPIHTFGFLKKAISSSGKDVITYINAGEYEKRNSASISNHYKNDYFNVLPDLSGIYKLEVIN